MEDYDASDKNKAIQTVIDNESLVTGIVYQDKETHSESQVEQMVANL